MSSPSSVTAGSTFKITVHGYFNCSNSRRSNHYTCANVATVVEFKGTFTCIKKFRRNGATPVDSGVGQGSDPRLHEGHKRNGISDSSPGPFRAKIRVKAPAAAGPYTLCADLFNFPVGIIAKAATAHFTVK